MTNITIDITPEALKALAEHLAREAELICSANPGPDDQPQHCLYFNPTSSVAVNIRVPIERCRSANSYRKTGEKEDPKESLHGVVDSLPTIGP